MNRDKQKEIFDSQTTAQEETMVRKGHDYCDTDVDILGNFKSVAQMCEISVDKVFQVMLATKFVRLRELTKGKEPLNEKIEDTFLDSICYTRLWDMYKHEDDNL